MADLTFNEKLKFEIFFGMKSGYVLDFSDRTFQEFVGSVTGKDILDQKYNYQSGSKANRLRAFIRDEPNHLVGLLLEQLLEYQMQKYNPGESVDQETFQNYESCLIIARKLKEGGIVEQLDALQPNNDDKDFRLIAKSIRDSIEKNEPEVALDRLHTFTVKYLRQLCDDHQILYDKAESLNAIFGKYVRYLSENGLIDSPMSDKILRYSINVIEAFNDIRNNRSLAHDNPILNYEESILIFNNLSNSIKFIQSIENKNKKETQDNSAADWESLPF